MRGANCRVGGPEASKCVHYFALDDFAGRGKCRRIILKIAEKNNGNRELRESKNSAQSFFRAPRFVCRVNGHPFKIMSPFAYFASFAVSIRNGSSPQHAPFAFGHRASYLVEKHFQRVAGMRWPGDIHTLTAVLLDSMQARESEH